VNANSETYGEGVDIALESPPDFITDYGVSQSF
jgi:hypothetical protein